MMIVPQMRVSKWFDCLRFYVCVTFENSLYYVKTAVRFDEKLTACDGHCLFASRTGTLDDEILVDQ